MVDPTTTPTTEAPIEKNERDTPEYWRKWLKTAERAAQEHWDRARLAWDEYENKPVMPSLDGRSAVVRCYPIYWSSCKTLEPAYYSRTPKVTTRRRFDIKDDTAATACIIAERLGQYLIECSEFDAVMQACVQDFIHADKTAPQLLYEMDGEPEQVSLQQVGTDFVTAAGQPWPDEVFQDATGYFGKTGKTIPATQKIYLASCPYDEVLHSPEAKSESEIQEKAYYFYMTKEQAERRFAEKAKEIQWKKKASKNTGDLSDHDRRRTEGEGEFLEGWEIWSRPEKRVYWLSNQYQGGFLDSREDPYKLREFFPSPPFIIGSKPSKSLYPVPAHSQLLPLLEELHTAADRVSRLIKGIRRRAVVDPSLEELTYALEGLDSGEFIVAKNFANIVEKGGVENLVQYLPVQELVQAITELTTLQDKFKNEFFEWFGVPDILRGFSEPMESASSVQIKAESAHDRFKWQKKLVQQLARDSIEMMVDLALGVYDDTKIAECVGYQFMTPADQQRFPAALAMLRDDRARMIRLEIESDSMSFVDEQLRATQVNNAVKAMTAGLKEVSQMIEISPQAAAVGLQALLLSLDTMPAGKEFHDDVKQTLQALIDQAKQPKQPAPPPPDYEAMKIQVQQQKLQIEAQRDQMSAQIQTREADRKDYEIQLKAGADAAAQQLEQYKLSLEQARLQTEGQLQTFLAQLEQQRVQIENFKAQMQARESEMEEIRLAREAEVEQYKAAVETAQAQPPAEPTPPQIINITPPAMPPINVVVDAKQGAPAVSKRVSVVRDELGNAVGYEVSENPPPMPILPGV